MVTLMKVGSSLVPNSSASEIWGLSTDTKPSLADGVTNGSVYYAFDTQEVYIFDETNDTWILQG